MSTMDRPQKLEGDTTKYSFLLETMHLEALKIIAHRKSLTTATLLRHIVEDYIAESPIFQDEKGSST